MPRYIAFLRAINVGKRLVKMERLRKIFEETGATKVETFINSGNVIFESLSTNEAALTKKIETQLKAALGYEVPTFLRTDVELARIAAHCADEENATWFVGFMGAKPNESSVNALLAARDELNEFDIDGRELYWLCRTNLLKSKFSGAKLEKMLGLPMTLRNVNTVQRLAVKYAA